jgi:hypothetical protein
MSALTHISNRIRRGSKMVSLVATRPAIMLRSARYLFLLSHMRSRSTMFSHVLGSHPEVSGYLETHIPYKSIIDFLELRKRVSEAQPGKPLSRYVMDKVLHNWYATPALLDRMAVQPIYLVRAPEESIKSICGIMKDESEEQLVRRAVNHYVKRLQWLENCARRMATRGVFVESSSLLDHTPDVFRLLEEWLGLSTPLRESYDIFSATGKPVYGDMSENIRAGQIVRDGRTSYSKAPSVPPALLDQAQNTYDRCVRVLRKRCRHIG